MKKFLLGIAVIVILGGASFYIASPKPEIVSSTISKEASPENQSLTATSEKETYCPPKFTSTGNQSPEKIIVAVEEETAKQYPEWRTHAQEAVDYLNSVLEKNTKKRYEIGKFITFTLEQYKSIHLDPSFHFDNGYGGTTIFWSVYSENPQKELDTQYFNAMTTSNINGKNFSNIWLVENEVGAILKGRETLDRELPKGTYDRLIATLIHETGHTLGLAYGEWYQYDFKDRTGILPDLGEYNFKKTYPKDPMTLTGSNEGGYQFSDFNAYIINHNIAHQYSPYDIARSHSSTTIVRVKDAQGNPISGASVKVFGAKKNCYYCKPLANPTAPLQNLLTDNDGEVEIENISENFDLNEYSYTGWIAKIIKASYGTRTAGAVTTLVDSQRSCIMKGSDMHYIDLIL